MAMKYCLIRGPRWQPDAPSAAGTAPFRSGRHMSLSQCHVSAGVSERKSYDDRKSGRFFVKMFTIWVQAQILISMTAKKLLRMEINITFAVCEMSVNNYWPSDTFVSISSMTINDKWAILLHEGRPTKKHVKIFVTFSSQNNFHRHYLRRLCCL